MQRFDHSPSIRPLVTLTRTRRRALAVPFVITMVAGGSACGSDADVRPAGDPVTTDVISNPAPPEPENTVVVANPAPPQN